MFPRLWQEGKQLNSSSQTLSLLLKFRFNLISLKIHVLPFVCGGLNENGPSGVVVLGGVALLK